MGHKSGLRHITQQESRAELEAHLDGDGVSAKELAQEHVPASIKTLVRGQRHTLTKRQKARGDTLAPWAVRSKCAKDMIDIAHGRPETRNPEDRTSGAGLTVHIHNLTLGQGHTQHVVTEEEIAENVREAIEVTAEPDSVPSEPEWEVPE